MQRPGITYILVIICGAIVISCNSAPIGPPDSSSEKKIVPPEYTVTSDIKTLNGILTEKYFWGAAGYGEDTTVDARETACLLLLDFPVTVDVNNGDQHSMLQVKTIQIIFSRPLNQFLNKRVKVSGPLLLAETGHHHTDVIINASSIEF